MGREMQSPSGANRPVRRPVLSLFVTYRPKPKTKTQTKKNKRVAAGRPSSGAPGGAPGPHGMRLLRTADNPKSPNHGFIHTDLLRIVRRAPFQRARRRRRELGRLTPAAGGLGSELPAHRFLQKKTKRKSIVRGARAFQQKASSSRLRLRHLLPPRGAHMFLIRPGVNSGCC